LDAQYSHFGREKLVIAWVMQHGVDVGLVLLLVVSALKLQGALDGNRCHSSSQCCSFLHSSWLPIECPMLLFIKPLLWDWMGLIVAAIWI
jgi:hypothetical protein